MISVLIVEDQEIAAAGVRMVLESDTKLTVAGIAVNGREAIDAAVKVKPDVVLMDIAMPVMSGIDATREIKQILPDVNVVMLTTYERDEDIFGAFSAGAQGYCMKDISSDLLKLAIQTVASGATFLDPRIAQRVLNASKTGVPSAEKFSKTVNGLSARELEVLQLVAEGLTNVEIAKRLFLSVETVKTHVRHVMDKLQVGDRTQAAVKALKEGYL